MRESAQALRAYQDYVAQAPPRSLDRLAQRYQSGTEAAPPTRRLTTLKQWSTQHAWQERIAAHERAMAAERAAEDADKRRKMAEARIAIAIAEMDLGSRSLRAKAQRPEDLSVRDTVALLQQSFDTQRRDSGEPDRRIALEGHVDVDPRELNDDELDAYIARLRASIGAGRGREGTAAPAERRPRPE